MKRPIKFRAWQTTHDGKGQMLNDYLTVDNNLHFNAADLTNNGEGDIVELMQYTGLLDKNGKEIYEGDIVNTYHIPFDEEKKVLRKPEKFDDGTGVVEFCKDELYWRVRTKTNFTPRFNSQRAFEIIGNVYQNPELQP